MKIGIIQFPGSNCERETCLAIQRAGMEPVEFLWNQPLSLLESFAGYVLVGGFSYEDRSRAGIIAALDPVMETIKAQAELGKPVLGICNGAQILVETGLVPGIEGYPHAVALTENKRIAQGKVLGTGFYNNWVHLKASQKSKPNAFTRYFTEDTVITIPAAHAQGRFVMDDSLWEQIKVLGLNALSYCTDRGEVDHSFPTNPNGSIGNMAALINASGNVMAIMPHPERTLAGDLIFKSMRDYVIENKAFTQEYLDYTSSASVLKSFCQTTSRDKYELFVELMITDNQAMTVQQALHRLNLPVSVQRFVHWELLLEKQQALIPVLESGVLFNDQKEKVYSSPHTVPLGKNVLAFLVREKDNLQGIEKKQLLEDHFALNSIKTIEHGVLWVFSGDLDWREIEDRLLKSYIIHNPCSHECYRYEF